MENNIEKWEVDFNNSVGKIKFGMDRIEVRNIINKKYVEFKKTELSKNTTDDYGKYHIYYDIDNKFEAIEFFEDVEIIYNGTDIFSINIDKIEILLPGIEKDEYGYIDIKRSIGICLSDDNQIESILIGKKDYYI